ncbi:MAG: TIGR03621 family F420-dependent LLM class oxidoreductase [Aestuariibacter sp.]
MPVKPFRFGVVNSNASSLSDWQAKVRKVEQLGYSSLLMTDHMDDSLAPLVALATAAQISSNLQLGTLVLSNDFRPPHLLAKEAATLDLLSEGRFELGLGAGWLEDDYQKLEIRYDSPGKRIARLDESVQLIKKLFAEPMAEFKGESYSPLPCKLSPQCLQKPHPRILIGGGAKKILSLAGREADIVGVNFPLNSKQVNNAISTYGTLEYTRQRIRWVEEAAGERFKDIELNTVAYLAKVVENRKAHVNIWSRKWGQSEKDLLENPHVLIGDINQIADTLEERREKYGFSYYVFTPESFEEMAPVVELLTGK